MKNKILSILLGLCLVIPCLLFAACGKNPEQPTTTNADIWDGSSTIVSNANDEGFIEIDSAEELRGFALSVNSGKTYTGEKIILTKNIDLANKEWEPIGYGFGTLKGSSNSGPTFKGEFYGDNHTIYNLKITTFIGGSDTVPAEASAEGIGLFGHIFDAKIEDLKINTAHVKGHHFVGALVGHSGGSSIINCHAANVRIDCEYFSSEAEGDKAGALIGCFGNGEYLNAELENCSVSNSTVYADRDAGQIVGMITNNLKDGMGSETVYSELTATNTTVVYNETGVGIGQSTGDNITQDNIGRINFKPLEEAE